MLPRRRILLISAGHPELARGGAQQVCHELFQELRSRSDTDCFLLASVDHAYPELFPDDARIVGFDGRDNEFLLQTRDHDDWWHKTSDPATIDAFVTFLSDVQPDVVHFHHFLTLGIDLLSLTRRVLPHCRIIFTFHEFRAVCAADGHMVRPFDRTLCDHASPVRCHQCFPDRLPSAFLQRRLWLMSHFAAVDRFTCPSRFMIEHYVAWGLPRNRITWVTNGQRNYAIESRTPAAPVQRKRFGFFGQLHDDKGVHIVLRAVSLLRASGVTDFRVELNGGGIAYASAPIRQEIEAFLAAERERPLADQIVSSNGPYDVDSLPSRMARIDWSIVPSVWWEIFGLVISEAWMFGKPVICSDAGGMRERVRHDVDGLLFDLGSPHSLAAAIHRACTEDGLWKRLRDALPQPPSRRDMAEGYLTVYATDPTQG
jgi:glycosyltransferase involved in cell wall biosynthesis